MTKHRSHMGTPHGFARLRRQPSSNPVLLLTVPRELHDVLEPYVGVLHRAEITRDGLRFRRVEERPAPEGTGR